MKVLLVEDNEMNRDMLTRRLIRRKYAVVTAVDGRAAVEAALTEQPDVVLMDLGLPVLDGWEATRQIKSDPRTASIPVIALTAHAMAEDRTRALAAGCDDFDTKPVDLARLCTKMAAVTARATGAESAPTFRATRISDLPNLANAVERACAGVNASAEAVGEVRLATEEVVTNILEHGYGGRPGPVTVDISARPEQIIVTITDEAPAFNPATVQAPELAAPAEDRELGGLGWHLAAQVMDEIGREGRAQGGNVFTLVKKLAAG